MCFNYVQIFSMSAIEKQMLCVWVLTLMTLYTRMSPMVILCLRRCLTVSSAMQRGSPVKGMRSVVEKERLVSAGKMFQLSFGDCSKASQTEMQNIFRKNIRYFNSHFAFTSFGASVDNRLATAKGTGVYSFKAHGQIYHRLDQLVPGRRGPRHMQLYFYGT